MGGPGSGNRWRSGAKLSTDDVNSIDVRRWAREGMLRPGYCGSWLWLRRGEVTSSIGVRADEDRLILSYAHRKRGCDWQDTEYPIPISRSPCGLGGTRPWFICPAAGCHRRVAVLFAGSIYACRHCHKVAYTSTREDAGDRAARRADRIRRRLGWKPGFLNGKGDKPKWMRWRTFSLLSQEHDRLIGQAIDGMAEKFGSAHRLRRS